MQVKQFLMDVMPITVAEPSKACTVFDCSETGIVGSNPTQNIKVWCVCVCVCVRARARAFSVLMYRQRPCDELITRPRSSSDCLRSSKPK
jgi:hypothetical protein